MSSRDKEYRRAYRLKNKEKIKEYRKRYREKNKEKLKEYRHNYYLKNIEQETIKSIEYKKKKPWVKIHSGILSRCNSPKSVSYKYYGKKGIKCLITQQEVKKLWFRDKAYNMKRPSIDRIDNGGNYMYDNCRFMELSENIKKDNKKTVYQRDLNGKLIKVFPSTKEVGRVLGLSQGDISNCCLGKKKTCGGYLWSYDKLEGDTND